MTHTDKLWGKKEGLSPVLSSTFAFSGSEVFTINVRLLSVNTSINTAQCFTSYASFWLSHLFKESSRERKGDGERGEEEERCMWVHGAAPLRPLVASSAKQLWHQLMKLQQLLQGVEVIIAKKKKKGRQPWQRQRWGTWGRDTITVFFFSRRFVTKINLNVTSREKVKSQSQDRYSNCMAWRPYFKLHLTFIAELLTYANLT